MQTIQELKLSLEAVIEMSIGNLQLASVTAARSKLFVDAVKHHYNESLIVHEVVENVIELFKNDNAYLLKDSQVIDGVIFPSDMTSSMDDVMTALEEQLVSMGPDGAATVAAIATWTAEAMMKLPVAA
ncbi:hypothetical protein D3C85_13900 [compost metagenome]